MIEFISQPWPWYAAGPALALVMLLLLWFGGEFGVSASLRSTLCMLGAGKQCKFFDFDWKRDIWNLVFVLGVVIGGFIAYQYLMLREPVNINPDTIATFQAYGVDAPPEDGTLVPPNIFSWEALLSLKGILLIALGGFFVGFGSRYAGGCTSGHAISGLSNLQLPSLIAVIGFFIGGLLMSWFILPLILQL